MERPILNNILVWGHEQTGVLGSGQARSYDKMKSVYILIDNINDNELICSVIPSEEYVG